jgi:hypothetical protein
MRLINLKIYIFQKHFFVANKTIDLQLVIVMWNRHYFPILGDINNVNSAINSDSNKVNESDT